MARRYRFLGKFYSTIHQCGQHWWSQHLRRSHPRQGWLFSCSKTAKRCGRYVTYILMLKHQNQFASECQLAQQHHTCYHHKDDTRYKCAYCFSQCLITGASLFREHFYRTLDNIAMLSRSLRWKTACAEPTAVFIERPPFRTIDNDIA